LSDPYCFIDTAILVRYLIRDVEPLASQAAALISAIEREEIAAELSVTVILETIFAMTTQYGADRETLADALVSLIALDGLHLRDKRQVIEAIQLWGRVRRLSFPDAFHLVLASHSKHRRIATFDKGMGNVLPGVTRIEKLT
jgi:predicted nucleic acid-binding protein